ncbi:hypothetical protein B0J13DRAFT_209121 [Dactylonectria estremocensis]|uniref:Uncharacterized protein n=1 Tax=Dactylonectria estremocensis TaxID=1079267 RepID=A0A9P9D9Q2_9HYPO|nr:hypothetical protein B0J13DRAFT_209121 [Dactylonectria estremocensis]
MLASRRGIFASRFGKRTDITLNQSVFGGALWHLRTTREGRWLGSNSVKLARTCNRIWMPRLGASLSHGVLRGLVPSHVARAFIPLRLRGGDDKWRAPTSCQGLPLKHCHPQVVTDSKSIKMSERGSESGGSSQDETNQDQKERWYRRVSKEKVAMVSLTIGGVILAALQVYAAWSTAITSRNQLQLNLNTTHAAQDVAWQTYLAAERLMILINDTMMIPRLLIMQLCADHPNVSNTVCANVTTWSHNKGYLETGLLSSLYPYNGTTPIPGDQFQQNMLNYTPERLIDAPEGQAVVALSALAGSAIILAAVLWPL